MAEPHHHDETGVTPGVKYEHSDASFWGIIGFGVGLAALALFAHLFLLYLLKDWRNQEITQKEQRYGVATPLAVTLPSDLGRDQPLNGPVPAIPLEGVRGLDNIRQWREPDLKRAGQYGWIEGQQGKVAHIPIDVAMDLAAKRLGEETKDKEPRKEDKKK